MVKRVHMFGFEMKSLEKALAEKLKEVDGVNIHIEQPRTPRLEERETLVTDFKQYLQKRGYNCLVVEEMPEIYKEELHKIRGRYNILITKSKKR